MRKNRKGPARKRWVLLSSKTLRATSNFWEARSRFPFTFREKSKLIKKLVFSAAIVFLGNSYLAAGAGVLPYTFNQKGELIFLLGKSYSGSDRNPPQNDRMLYGDFAGGANPGEDSIETAAREFNEETAFFFAPRFDSKRRFPDDPYDDFYREKDKARRAMAQRYGITLIKRELKKGPQPLKVTSRDEKHSTTMYLLKIDWVSGRDLLAHLKKMETDDRASVPSSHLEVKRFNWVPYSELKGLKEYEEFEVSPGCRGRLKLYFQRLIQRNQDFFQNLAASGGRPRRMRQKAPRREIRRL